MSYSYDPALYEGERPVFLMSNGYTPWRLDFPPFEGIEKKRAKYIVKYAVQQIFEFLVTERLGTAEDKQKIKALKNVRKITVEKLDEFEAFIEDHEMIRKVAREKNFDPITNSYKFCCVKMVAVSRQQVIAALGTNISDQLEDGQVFDIPRLEISEGVFYAIKHARNCYRRKAEDKSKKLATPMPRSIPMPPHYKMTWDEWKRYDETTLLRPPEAPMYLTKEQWEKYKPEKMRNSRLCHCAIL